MSTPIAPNPFEGVVKKITDNEFPGLPPRLVIVTPDDGGADIVFGVGRWALLAINDRVSYQDSDRLYATLKKI
ncbi:MULTISPECIES: hypothetical protein [unclassified Pseudomonas]|uniref:hypothetical protein n=1 Tax=unclassified Pseudomonas TaxID=196821 RepID=UPI00111C807D|nr:MULTISPECIES: hypothetical protein [unclassified Pseudomonas]